MSPSQLLCRRPLQEGRLDRQSYSQGMPQAVKDYADGHRDALRVLADMVPLWDSSKDVTEGYRTGWDLAVREYGL